MRLNILFAGTHHVCVWGLKEGKVIQLGRCWPAEGHQLKGSDFCQSNILGKSLAVPVREHLTYPITF